MSDLRIGVIGAGVVGLTTALQLQQEFRGVIVSILADKFDDNTTSNGAAGIFRPGTSFSGPTEQITRKWISDAYHHWDDIRLTEEANKAGIAQISGYIYSSTFPHIVENDYIEKLVPLYRKTTEEELMLCPGNWKYGSFFTTLLVECRLYLPWARQIFQNAGGKVIKTKVDKFQDISDKYDVIVNCTGLEAKFLCNDNKIVPLRGQVQKVHAPWIKTFFYADYDTYIIPGFNAVTLGGCRQYDSYKLSVCPHDSAAIRERCESLVPSLRQAPVLQEWVGLRPHRSIVRVEKEIIQAGNKTLKIVHNYGHGGYGVTTAPGTAVHAVELVRETLMGNSKL